MVETQVLYDDDGLTISARLIDGQKLDIEYFDLGGSYGDYEHHTTLTAEATQKLCAIYQCQIDDLPEKVKENFKGMDRVQPFKDFCNTNKLEYTTFTWIEDD